MEVTTKEQLKQYGSYLILGSATASLGLSFLTKGEKQHPPQHEACLTLVKSISATTNGESSKRHDLSQMIVNDFNCPKSLNS